MRTGRGEELSQESDQTRADDASDKLNEPEDNWHGALLPLAGVPMDWRRVRLGKVGADSQPSFASFSLF